MPLGSNTLGIPPSVPKFQDKIEKQKFVVIRTRISNCLKALNWRS
ncbi:hypothetical protein HMPREF9439_00231 [Parasutterella excrementihominis YIT 11859]|uniref:Uncharacterized protein n=1 Tax=Parasutterella excrementihominis YIT 11859 TaxID=762966 RepID=F3QH40_9BURK|nr:hypothetical protein HMPREF9439_00231 [Parasutterella excrementihominis YIT 11859]